MKKPSLKVVVEFKINSVTCPNVRLDPSKWVHLRICLLGTCLRTRLLKAQFPLQVDEKMRVERTFPLCSAIKHLYSALTAERLSIEIVQLHQFGSKVLALFSTELNDIIFDSPNTIRDREVRTDHYTLILHTTHHFPGIANPHLNALITVKLIQVNDSAIEISRDGGYNLTLGLKGSEYPYYQPPYQEEPLLNVSSHWSEKLYPPRICQRIAITSRTEQPKIKPINRKIFCVRHVDDKLIGRMPSADSSPINAEYTPRSSFYTPPNSIKSPWLRSTFQMETVSSLLRRKPKIIHSSAGPERDEKCGWFSYNRCTSGPPTIEVLQPMRQRRHSVTRESTDSQYAYQQEEFDLDSAEKNDGDTHNWVNHNSEICTLCQLYYEYFGQYYPMHT